MNFLPPEIEAYAEKFTEPESDVLKELNRETYAHVLVPRMLSGHMQGRILSMFSKMIKPKLILEIGTYTGYSALCLAEGLQPGGILHTIDINEELEDMIKHYISKAGMYDKIKLHIGNATDVIKTIEGTFDLVFIDADKENYSNYFDMVINRVAIGGYIIADNVLWSGNVIKPESEMDDETKALVKYSEKVFSDNRVEQVLFPVRDGLLVARKK